jgi:hypothetical protein
MIDKQPKKIHMTLAFDVVDGEGVDITTATLCADGQSIGPVQSLNLAWDVKKRYGKFQYSQFRNVRETDDPGHCGTWNIHTYGDNEPND